MPDTTAGARVFDESEMDLILAERVKSETASLAGERDTLVAEKADLANKLDVETSAREAAEQRATAAEKALEDFKTEITQREEAAQRKTERMSKVREAASHLTDDFFNDESRATRIVAMDEETFEGYLGDLKASAGPAAASTPPRETAMEGAAASKPNVPAPAAVSFFSRGLPTAQKEG